MSYNAFALKFKTEKENRAVRQLLIMPTGIYSMETDGTHSAEGVASRREDTPSRQKKENFFCFALNFSYLCTPIKMTQNNNLYNSNSEW